MKWHAQVAHVARKDVRLFRWMIAAYAGVVVAATAAVGWNAFGAEASLLWTLALVTLGMILFALVIQADSPARDTPFWVTLPLHRSAVFSSKLAVGVLVVLGLPLAGQAAGLFAHAVPAGDVPALLGRSALSLGLWLGTAGVIAALTPDLRTFLLALTGTTLGAAIAGQAIVSSLGLPGVPGSPSLLVWAVALCCMVLLIAHQYLTRRVRRGLAAGALLWAAGLLVPLATARSAPPVEPAPGVVPGPLRAAITIEEVQFHPGAGPMMMLRLEGASPAHRYALVSPLVTLHMPDGTSSAVPVSGTFTVFGGAGVHVDGIRWVNGPGAGHDGSHGVPLTLTPAQRRALEHGGARLSLRGRLEIRESRVAMELPFVAGAAAASRGLRMEVARAEMLAQGPSAEVRTSKVASSRRIGAEWGSRPWGGAAEYALVNRTRGEGVVMITRGGTGTMGGLVVPGPHTETYTAMLGSYDPTTAGMALEPAWLKEARLVLLEWVPVGSYPIAAEPRDPPLSGSRTSTRRAPPPSTRRR